MPIMEEFQIDMFPLKNIEKLNENFQPLSIV